MFVRSRLNCQNYTVTTGSLPPGVTLYSSIGLLYGYPTTPGTYNFTIKATDANNCIGNKNYSGPSTDFNGKGKSNVVVWWVKFSRLLIA